MKLLENTTTGALSPVGSKQFTATRLFYRNGTNGLRGGYGMVNVNSMIPKDGH